MKQKWVDGYMDTARRFAKLSSSQRLKVGAVVVKDNRIISIGYNGTPAGWDNTCEIEVIGPDNSKSLVTKDEVIHAEANAIIKLARAGDGGENTIMFCTHAPCMHCAKLIYGAGIVKLYYSEVYRDKSGIEFLEKCQIELVRI